MSRAVRMLALALCVIAAGTLALMSLQIAFPALMAMLAAIGATGRYGRNVTRQTESRIALGVAVLFALRWMLLPAPGLGAGRARFVSVGLLDYEFAYPIAQALLLWAVLLFFVRRGGALPQTLPLYPALVVILAGTMPSRAFGAWQGPAYQGAALALAMASGAYFCIHTPARHDDGHPPARARRNAYVAVSVVVLSFGWALGALLQRHGMDLDMMIIQLMPNSAVVASPGFSGEGRLDHINAVKNTNTERVALRVTSATMPGYLRGKAFDTFDGQRWSSTAATAPMRPSDSAGLSGGARWFPLAEGDADRAQGAMLVEPASPMRGAVFARLESARVAADVDTLSVDAHRIVEANQLEPGAPYRVEGELLTDRAPDAAERETLTAVPAETDARIRAIANEIARAAANDEARVAGVAAYLNATCTYSLDVKKGPNPDPVAAFLFETHAGHCELFASAAVLLLRCMDVPCRYVTGFVAVEQNAYGGYWVARNRDAHAWAEAYIEGSGWTTVEVTPANGVPQGEPSRWAQLWDYAVHEAKAAIAALRNMNARELVDAAARLLVRCAPAIAALLAACALWWALRRYAARRRQWRAALDADPVSRAMNRRLLGMDRRAARLGLVRAANETIDRFAERAAAAERRDLADWYSAYSRARYGGDDAAVRTVLGRDG